GQLLRLVGGAGGLREGAVGVTERPGAGADGPEMALRPEPGVVQLLRGHRRVLSSLWHEAAPRNEKGPGGWSRPGLWCTRSRRRSGRDERDATEVTGGHPSLGTTTERRQVLRHGPESCPMHPCMSSAFALQS